MRFGADRGDGAVPLSFEVTWRIHAGQARPQVPPHLKSGHVWPTCLQERSDRKTTRNASTKLALVKSAAVGPKCHVKRRHERCTRGRERERARPISSTHTSPSQLNHTVCTQARQSSDSVFTSSLEFRNMAIVAYASVNVAEHAARTQVKQSTRRMFTSSLVPGGW